jgi:ParB/RepB/Spo0J family partition protein
MERNTNVGIKRQTTRAPREGIAGKNPKKQTIKLRQLEVTHVPLDSVHPNPWNPNRQSEREYNLLIRSIEEDGFTQPIIVDKKRQIVDGEHRWKACHTLGIDPIPVVIVDMEDTQARISTLRHNRARGHEDQELTQKLLADLRDLGALDRAIKALDLDARLTEALLADEGAADLLAREVFSDAWIPYITAEPMERETAQGIAYSDYTDATQKVAREYNEQVALETSPKAISAIQQEQATQIKRIVISIPRADAPIVEAVIGTQHQAEHVLVLCKEELARREAL